MKRLMTYLFVGAMIFLTGCAASGPQQITSAYTAGPKSILVVPALNKSLEVDAGNYLLSTLAVPLAEKGFYVFPVNTTKTILDHEGLYEADRIHEEPPESLAKLFDADSILYVTINRWDAQYLVLSTTVTVDLDYRLVGRDGAELWKTNQHIAYTPQSNNSGGGMIGLVALAVNAAITRAAPDYMGLARQANSAAFSGGKKPFPRGPYAKSAS